jgi:glycosyltransferase involved in cell wall biosynthesis
VKVLYFSDNNTSGHNQRFLEKLSQAGLDVWFLDPAASSMPEDLSLPGVHWVECQQIMPRNADPGTFAGFLPEFQRLMKEIKPDVVHAGPIPTCGLVTALSGFHPYLLCSWGADILWDVKRASEWKDATRTALSSADAFFCDCDTVRAAARELVEIPDARIVQFPWGVRRGIFHPVGSLPPEAEYKREPDTHLFICTRAWEPIYSIETLLEAFRIAYRADSCLRLLLLGSGSQAERVQDFIETHGLKAVVRILGRLGKDEMPRWFRAADTYVSCAQTDSASVSLLEAMASGLPAIVTDIASNREWVEEGLNGWLAPAGSSEEFADRLLRAARLDPADRKVFSERNLRIVAERADWDRNFPKLLKMYDRMTGVLIGV